MAIYDLVLAILSETELAARNRVIDALRSRGAVSPATARPLSELGVATDDTWDRLVIEGRVREGPPGQFYLFEHPRPSTRRVLGMVVFYAVLVLIPVLLFLAIRN